MSHSFYISNVNNLKYRKVIDKISDKRLVLAEANMHNNPQDWPIGYLHFYIDQTSCRGIETNYDGSNFEVRILSASSLDDYKLGLKFVRTVSRLSGGSIEPEDDAAMDWAEFEKKYNNDWAKQHARTMLDMTVGIYKERQSTLTLSGVIRPFDIGPRFLEPLLKNPETFEDEFFRRFRRLQYIDHEDVFVASRIILGNKDNDNEIVKTTVLGEDVPTVLSIDTDLVSLHNNEGNHRHITLDSLIELVGDELEWLSESVFLTKAYSGTSFTELFDRAGPLSVEIEHHFRPRTEEEKEGPFSSDELEYLANAPLYIFFLVAAADGKIESREMEAFARVLTEVYTQANEVLRAICSMVLGDTQTRIEQIVENRPDIIAELSQINELLNKKLPMDVAREIKSGLFYIGQKTAEKPGGLLRFGKKKIKKQEKKALAAIAMIFELIEK